MADIISLDKYRQGDVSTLADIEAYLEEEKQLEGRDLRDEFLAGAEILKSLGYELGAAERAKGLGISLVSDC